MNDPAEPAEHIAPAVRTGDPRPLATIAGVDVAYDDDRGVAHAAAVALDAASLAVLTTAVVIRPTTAPYVPGQFTRRELDPALAALRQLAQQLGRAPDVVLVDGHGLAHPRRRGLACAIGLALDWPTIGVAKNPLVGDARPGPTRGDRAPLDDGGEPLGLALRTRDGVKPVYVSTGHRVALEPAAAIVLACAPRYRLPEPLRAADQACRASRAAHADAP